MALKEAGRHYRSTASGGFSLTCPANESWRVRNIHCVPSSNDTYVTLAVAGKTVLKLRAKGKTGNHIPYPVVKATQLYERVVGTVFDLARKLGCPLDVPVASGETLALSRYAETGELSMVYDVYDPADVAATEPNGSKGAIERYVHYVENSAAIIATPCTLDTSLMWTSGEAWPVGGIQVPDDAEIQVHAILGAPASRGNASANKGATLALVLKQEGVVLFDPLYGLGLPLVGDVAVTADAVAYTPIASVIGPATAEQPQSPFVPPAPLVFKAGAKLTPQVSLVGAASGGIAASQLDVAFLLERKGAA
jgi:hypothetical protein